MLLVPPSRATVRAEPWTRLERPRREAGEGVRPAPARERVPRPSAEVSTACWAEHGWQRGTSGGAGRPWRSDSGPRSEDQGCTEHDHPPRGRGLSGTPPESPTAPPPWGGPHRVAVTLSTSAGARDIPVNRRHVVLTTPRARPCSRGGRRESDKPGGLSSSRGPRACNSGVGGAVPPVMALGEGPSCPSETGTRCHLACGGTAAVPASAVTRAPRVRASNVPLLLRHEDLLLHTRGHPGPPGNARCSPHEALTSSHLQRLS